MTLLAAWDYRNSLLRFYSQEFVESFDVPALLLPGLRMTRFLNPRSVLDEELAKEVRTNLKDLHSFLSRSNRLGGGHHLRLLNVPFVTPVRIVRRTIYVSCSPEARLVRWYSVPPAPCTADLLQRQNYLEPLLPELQELSSDRSRQTNDTATEGTNSSRASGGANQADECELQFILE